MTIKVVHGIEVLIEVCRIKEVISVKKEKDIKEDIFILHCSIGFLVVTDKDWTNCYWRVSYVIKELSICVTTKVEVIVIEAYLGIDKNRDKGICSIQVTSLFMVKEEEKVKNEDKHVFLDSFLKR